MVDDQPNEHGFTREELSKSQQSRLMWKDLPLKLKQKHVKGLLEELEYYESVAGETDVSPNDTEERVRQLTAVQTECRELFARKNHDYGSSFAKHGPVGVLVRIGDKVERLMRISRSGVVLVDDERLRDTLIDLSNYAAMAVMLMDEEDKGE